MKKHGGSWEQKDKWTNIVSLLIIFIVLFTSVILTVMMEFQMEGIVGSDFNTFHYKLADMYARGENALFSRLALQVNGGPYPPLFHLFFALMILIGPGVALFFAHAFQLLFYPAMMAATLYLVHKKMGLKQAAFTGAIMLGSIALFDRAAQVTPQAIDMIFFPLAIYFFIENRKIAYVTCMAITIYAHGVWALLPFAGLVLYSVIRKRNVKYQKYVIFATIPILMLTAAYLPGYFGYHGNAQSQQEELSIRSVTYFLQYTGIIISAAALVCIVWGAVLYIRKRKFPYELSELEMMSLYWLVSLLPVLIFLRDRFASYAVPPMAILMAGFLSRMITNRAQFIATIVVITLASMLFILLSWAALFQTGDLVTILI
jgi:hypothetical protein